jgi:nitrite reductase/ring-hydroxylating ferredoxin subunit
VLVATPFEKHGQFHKTAGGIAYGWAVVSTIDGLPYTDLQGDYIPADTIPEVAAEFMAGQRVGKDLHAGEQVADVLFAWPATDEINRGVEYSGRKTGLLIGWRPYDKSLLELITAGERVGFSIGGELHSAEMEDVDKAIAKAADAAGPKQRRVYRAWKLREISLVDYPAQEPALVGIVKGARPAPVQKRVIARVYKRLVITSPTDGHAHSLDLEDPSRRYAGLMTSYQTSEGADASHCHAWTYDPATGSVTIAPDSGHDHGVTELVPADILAAAAANEDDTASEAVPMPVVDEPSSGKTSVVVVAARAPAGISTPAQPAPTVDGKSQENPLMDPKFAKMLAAALALPEPQRLHVAKLGPDDQAAFLGLSPADQDSAVKAAEAADPEVYKTTAGISIRKSHGPLAEQMARQADTTAAELAKQAQQLAIEKAERARVTLEKRASDLIPLIGASLAERVAIIKAVDGIAEEATRNGALEALKGANEAFRLLGVPQGAGGDAVPENKSPRKAWDDGLADFAKSKSIANPLDAIVPFLKTEQGQTLRKALDAQRPLAQAS